MINNRMDELSKRKAYNFLQAQVVENDEVGKTISLQKIHAYLFEGLYEFAGRLRTQTISKGGFVFANGDFLPQVLKDIDKMPDNTFKEIVAKYVEMNIAHPFMEGNGRATRIWLDLLLKNRIQKCIDWSKITKDEYFEAMIDSPTNPEQLYRLFSSALSDKIDNAELFRKGIDQSYRYEEED